ncbi:MAG: 4'-phosphopantetheinyl transferase superfamily protein [Muribaculum sp.]|nr:4'-phosphopantetheinyl transferase superfamily protein [Muribaculum sp.]
METDFIYWRHRTPAGIKVEEVSGAEDKKGKLWREMALQIYCENGKDSYRQIGHFRNGAPFLEGDDARISLSHADHLLVVATLPRTPETDLRDFSTRTCMGIDAERADRGQVLKIRSKFLSDEELGEIAEDDVAANILAWTIKEASYKAALCEGMDFRNDIRIIAMPSPTETVVGNTAGTPGKAEIRRHDDNGNVCVFPLDIFSWISEGCIVSLAYSPQCAKFTKNPA